LKEGELEPARGFSPALFLRLARPCWHYTKVRWYRRRLPHLDADGSAVFVTWRLRGSLPQERVFSPEHVDSGEAFMALDRLLDGAPQRTRVSPPARDRKLSLGTIARDRFAESVLSARLCCDAEPRPCSMDAPRVAPRIGPSSQGSDCPFSELAVGAHREAFWQEEYFDRLVRNDADFRRIRRYIEWNPVSAALVAHPEEFRWSSAYAGLKPHAG
jgi:hypothetical protein